MVDEKNHYYGSVVRRNLIVEQLISIIEHEKDQLSRMIYLRHLKRKKLNSNQYHNFLEDISVSDLNKDARILAIKILINNFFEQSHFLIEWIIRPEHSPSIIFSVIHSLSKGHLPYLRALLVNNLEEYIKTKNQNFNIEIYNKELRVYFSKNPLEKLSITELGNIYINYTFVLNLENRYNFSKNTDKSNLFFKLDNGVINELRIWGILINKISDIDGIERISNLKILDLAGNHLKEIDALENLQHLVLLKFGDLCYGLGNELTQIKGLETLKKLKILNLSNNYVKKIEGLSSLSDLKRLYLVHNKITEIEGLATLENLKYLNLEKNQIRVIKNIDNLKNLELLDLGNNFISELDNLEELSNLKEVRIHKNNISEVGSLPSNVIIKLHENDAQQTCFLDKVDLKIVKVDEFEKPKEYDSRYLQ